MNARQALDFFAVMGILSSVWIVAIGLHELGHAWNYEQQKIGVREICIFGYNYENKKVSWAAANGTVNNSAFEEVWDFGHRT